MINTNAGGVAYDAYLSCKNVYIYNNNPRVTLSTNFDFFHFQTSDKTAQDKSLKKTIS